MIEYSIRAVETQYRGSLFRSRLEATWAAFFDLVGIKWLYEPIDLKGWTPDFKINHTSGICPEGLYVEVKPTLEMAKAKAEQLFNLGTYIQSCTNSVIGS